MIENENKINIERDVNIHLENRKISRGFFWFIWILYVMVSMTKNCYNTSLASIKSEGILSVSEAGFITAMFYLVYTPLQIVGGVLADKFSPEKMIKIGLVGAALSNAVIFFCQNYYVMLGAWIFNGIIQFGIWPSVFKIVSSQLVRSDRAKMTFYLSFTATAGVLVSYVVGAFVTDWRYNFMISAITLIVFAVALHVYERFINPYMKWDTSEIEQAVENNPRVEGKVSTMKVFLTSGFFFMLIGTILYIVVSQSRTTLTPIMLGNFYKSSDSVGNILTAVLLVASILGNIISRKFVSKSGNEVLSMILVFSVMLPIWLGCGFIGKVSMPIIIVMFALIACLEAMANLLRTYYTLQFAKYRLSGTAAGILNAGCAFSYMLAAYVIPKIVEVFGWNALFVLLPILIAITIICLVAIVKLYGKFKKGAL